MTTYNTGTTASLDDVTKSTAFTFTIPPGVLAGDVMLVVIECFAYTSSAPGFATPTSGGGSWTAIPSSTGHTIVDSGASEGLDSYVTAWVRVATAGDPSSTFTISFNGTVGATNAFWWDAAMASYTGASTTGPVDVSAGQGALAATVTCPSKTTGVAGDWAIYMCGVTAGGAGAITGPSGSTQRQNVMNSANVGAALFDSNGSVGASGTSIGGGTFSQPSAGSWWGAFTVGLAPAGAAAAPAPAPPPQLVPPGFASPMAFTALPAVPPPNPVYTTTASDSDTGAGADTASPAPATLTGAEAGSGADAAVSVAITSSDTGSGADVGTAVLGASGSDTGSGAESAAITGADVTSGDTGTGAESSAIAATAPASADTGSGADVAGVVISSSDTGSGTDLGTQAVAPPPRLVLWRAPDRLSKTGGTFG